MLEKDCALQGLCDTIEADENVSLTSANATIEIEGNSNDSPIIKASNTVAFNTPASVTNLSDTSGAAIISGTVSVPEGSSLKLTGGNGKAGLTFDGDSEKRVTVSLPKVSGGHVFNSLSEPGKYPAGEGYVELTKTDADSYDLVFNNVDATGPFELYGADYTVTLNNSRFEPGRVEAGAASTAEPRDPPPVAAISAVEGALTLELVGENRIYVETEAITAVGNLIIGGTGSLVVESIEAGDEPVKIYSEEGSIEIKGDAAVTVPELIVPAANKVTVSSAAKVNAVAVVGDNHTVYGNAIYPYGKSFSAPDSLIIPEGTSLTIPEGATLTFTDNLTNLNRALITIINEGELINNGTIEFKKDATDDAEVQDYIGMLKPTGSGSVKATVGSISSEYTNDGDKINEIVGDLDFSDPATLPPAQGNGYEWNAANNTLTLKHLNVTGNIVLPDAACTVNIIGKVSANELYLGNTYMSENASTINGDPAKGGRFDGKIMSPNDLTLNNVTMNGDIEKLNSTNDSGLLTLQNSTMASTNFKWDTIDGIALKGSTLTVGKNSGYFIVRKIVMDDGSIINMHSVLTSGKDATENGLAGIMKYLPAGYTIKRYEDTSSGSRTYYTIWDSKNNSNASNLTIQKQPSNPNPTPNPTPNPGPSGGGSYSDDSTNSYTIEVSAGDNGTITPSGRVSVTYGASKTFTIKANDGYAIAYVLVDGKSVGAVTTYTFENVQKSHTISAAFSKTYPDVTKDDWFKESVYFVTARGMMSGTGDGKFNPNAPMTRGMFVTALGNLANANISAYKTSSFTDVDTGAYYLGHAEWAVKNNIVTGTSATTFAPNQAITRQEMAVIMQNYAKAIGYNLSSARTETVFADSANIEKWAKPAVKEMQMAGVMMGKNGNNFDPTATATRAEGSAVLRRFAALKAGGKATSGWETNDSGSRMYFENGKAVTGKKGIGGKTYEFNSDGICIVPDSKKHAIHKIVYGDTLWDISIKNHCTVADIVKLNGIADPNNVPVGTELKIPQK